jgi:cyclic beta-1,2-glucan synthetase
MALGLSNGMPQAWMVLFGLIAILPCSELALSLLHHYVNLFVLPRPLPRMETEHGIPADARTMVVIPTLFTRPQTVIELVERLEIHALANPDPNLSFALLGDFSDADTETEPLDDTLVEIAKSAINSLNEKHDDSETSPRFHLFVRRRKWNESEGKWMGWERKRGKILEFNRLLRGAQDTTYIVATADTDYLKDVHFVITLDSDTSLPRDAARKLVGTIIHPLNRPQYDPVRERITTGYSILQPRISVNLESGSSSRFARIFSGNIGLDPYTTAVSDVYQDLFKEGTFTGKGLYVVDSFELALENRVPENTILSHDLFESAYARSALVTDVELFDDYPQDYDTFSSRSHRWTRGDWQIAPWIFGKVPLANGQRVRNRLSILSRWKIFDNIRRSLLPTLAFLGLDRTSGTNGRMDFRRYFNLSLSSIFDLYHRPLDEAPWPNLEGTYSKWVSRNKDPFRTDYSHSRVLTSAGLDPDRCNCPRLLPNLVF